MGVGIVRVRGVVDARGLNHNEIALVLAVRRPVEGVERRLGHLSEGWLPDILVLLTTVDLVHQVAVVEEADVRQADVAEATLENIELRAVLRDVVTFLLSKPEQVDVVATAGALLRARLEVAPAAAEEDVDALAERVAVANLLGSDASKVVAVADVGGEGSRGGVVDDAKSRCQQLQTHWA